MKRVEILAELSPLEDNLVGLMQEIQEEIGGPPAGVEYVIFADEQLGLRYLPYDWESVAYVQEALLYLQERTGLNSLPI
jgi:hypothetical protein